MSILKTVLLAAAFVAFVFYWHRKWVRANSAAKEVAAKLGLFDTERHLFSRKYLGTYWGYGVEVALRFNPILGSSTVVKVFLSKENPFLQRICDPRIFDRLLKEERILKDVVVNLGKMGEIKAGKDNISFEKSEFLDSKTIAVIIAATLCLARGVEKLRQEV